MGSVFLVPWTWLNGTIGDLNKFGFRTAAMALTDDSISIDHPILAAEPRLAIVSVVLVVIFLSSSVIPVFTASCIN